MNTISFNLSMTVVQIRTVSNALLVGVAITPTTDSSCSEATKKAVAEHLSTLKFNEFLHCFHLCEVNFTNSHLEFVPWLPLSASQFSMLAYRNCVSVSEVDSIYASQFEAFLKSNGVAIETEITNHMKRFGIHELALNHETENVTPPTIH